MRLSGWIALVVTPVALYLDFVAAPDDAVLGPSQRIFYVHMGAATVAGLAFCAAATASVLYLATRALRWDRLAASSVEIGTVFTSMLLVTGVIWGRVAWGVWWTWDPRLTATLMMWVLFIGYQVLRQVPMPDDRRARLSAAAAVIFFLDVPLDYLTVRWWRSIHPIVITSHGVHMQPVMTAAMVVTMVAMLSWYVAWMQVRMRLWRIEEGVQSLTMVARERL